MHSPGFEQAVAFGPFRMPQFRDQVDDRMRQAFYSYLAKKVLPLLEGRIVRIDGRVFSHYDSPDFAAIGEVRHRYYYELRLASSGGVEQAWGEVDYDPDQATFTPSRIKPPGVRTLTEVRRIEEARQALLEFQKRYAHHPGDYCPKCRSKQVARILYGLHTMPLSASLQADFDAGRIRFGGCCILEDSPKWRCLSCGSEWGAHPGLEETLLAFRKRKSTRRT